MKVSSHNYDKKCMNEYVATFGRDSKNISGETHRAATEP